MTWLFNHLWLVPLILNVVWVILNGWLGSGGTGPDGAAAAGLAFMLGIVGTIVIWFAFGLYHFLAWLF